MQIVNWCSGSRTAQFLQLTCLASSAFTEYHSVELLTCRQHLSNILYNHVLLICMISHHSFVKSWTTINAAFTHWFVLVKGEVVPSAQQLEYSFGKVDTGKTSVDFWRWDLFQWQTAVGRGARPSHCPCIQLFERWCCCFLSFKLLLGKSHSAINLKLSFYVTSFENVWLHFADIWIRVEKLRSNNRKLFFMPARWRCAEYEQGLRYMSCSP